MRGSRGFTLIELMIVVAIIAVIASIAIPNLLRSRIAANETSAAANLRTLHSAQTGYKLSGVGDVNGNGIGEYGSLANLTNTVPPWLDDVLGTGQRQGYAYVITLSGNAASDEAQWAASAAPLNWPNSGIRTFYIDESGILRGSDVGGAAATRAAATATFPPLGG